MLVHRVPALREPDAAEYLGLARKTLQNLRSKPGSHGPVYRKLPNGRVVYRLDDLQRYRDGDARTSTGEPYRDVTATQ